VLVANEPELSTFASVPVQYKDLPDNYEISSDVVESVYLEMRGPSGVLGSITNSSFAVVLDMSGVQRGERTFSVGDDNVKLPRGIRLVRAIPSQLRFDFEERATRDVPVEVRFSSARPAGYEVSGFDVSPRTLTVVGPESRVARVKTVVTDAVDVSKAVGTMEAHVNSFIGDAHVRFVSSPAVTVRVTMAKKP
jgi:YbbR domain-containing protein